MRQDASTEVLRQSFGGIAGDYDRYRPGPPTEAVQWLVPADAVDIVEIGAGTGALTRRLIGGHVHVRSVEPDERMRAILAERIPQAEVLAGRTEEIPVEDGSCDVVIGASMWHWVDERRAVPEVARVLRPGGTFALLWNGVDRSVDWLRSLWAGGEELGRDQADRIDVQRRERRVVHLDEGPFSEPEQRVVRWAMSMSDDDLIGMASTYSAVITMSEPRRQEHLTSMRRFLDAQELPRRQGMLEVPMRCRCWRSRRR